MEKRCTLCKKSYVGARAICLECFAQEKYKAPDHYPDPHRALTAYNRTGRPKGTTEYETAKVDDDHHMTPLAHQFIKENKRLIEDMARKRFEIQWKMF